MIISEKDGDPVRKSLLLILVLLLTAVCACAAAETEYALSAVGGKIAFDESRYIVLTPENLSDHPDLLTSIGKTADELRSDWEDRSVLMQAWSKDQKTCVEVSLFQDEYSAKYYDLEARSSADRRQYYSDILTKAREQGNVIISNDLKMHKKSGHYVVYQYLRNVDGKDCRGIARKTVRKGYTLYVDYQVYDRKPTKTDEDRSRHIINSVEIDTTVTAAQPAAVTGQEAPVAEASSDVPAGAAGMLSVTVLPPAKTNDGVFTVEGTAYPGSEVIVVAMRWSGSSASDHYNTVANKSGQFKVKVTLPEEGNYQMSITMDINNVPVADAFLNSVLYSKSALPYTLDAEIPEVLTSDELVISGTTVKNVEIQCIVMKGSVTVPIKSVKTNGTGKFRFKIPTKEEGEYDITLVFSKKNLSTERLTAKATRSLTAADTKALTASKAVKVSYNNLIKKLDSFIGQTLVYEAHITDVKQVGDEWMITAALKLNKGTYSNFLIYMAKDNPGLAAGSKAKLYGVCTGAYPVQSEEENISYPGFDYLFFE